MGKSVPELAKEWGVNVQTLYSKVRYHKLGTQDVPGGKITLSDDEIDYLRPTKKKIPPKRKDSENKPRN